MSIFCLWKTVWKITNEIRHFVKYWSSVLINVVFILFYRTRGIPWSNCIGYSSDHAFVMVGIHRLSVLKIKREGGGLLTFCHFTYLFPNYD